MTYFKTKVFYLGLRYKPAAQAIDNAKDLFKASAREAGKDINRFRSRANSKQCIKNFWNA